ncbi:MAG: molybdate ABC transporter permease subunit [Dissulfurimicrobium sp.]|uniref:molybdate ABC transporter permease subunit n=1 Tax=Dissulfurimicrobium TaxID=1769732 RepID=UPI001EDA6EF6|nr:ABC transporter permease [Dissulfurimicrobium hydrothermale]UKL13664.1 ABC transporter permease [Dissulfurimicrobium hydrothermale]
MNLKRLSIFCAFSTFSVYAGLVLSMCYFLSGRLFVETILSGRTLFSIRLSLLCATIATALSVCLAVPSAYALSRFDFKGKDILDTTLEFPMVVSPAALGALLLIFFNTPLGGFVQKNTFQFVFAFAGIVLAQFVTTLGVATRLLKAALDEIPRRYEDVARTLGASPLSAFFSVTLPLARRGILASIILTWAKALGEFGATIMVAGSMAMRTETLPVAIFMRLASADIEGAVVLILILVSVGFFVLYVARFLIKARRHA